MKTSNAKGLTMFYNEIDLRTRVVHFVQRNFLPNFDFLNIILL